VINIPVNLVHDGKVVETGLKTRPVYRCMHCGWETNDILEFSEHRCHGR
jgi:hypothetical protein